MCALMCFANQGQSPQHLAGLNPKSTHALPLEQGENFLQLLGHKTIASLVLSSRERDTLAFSLHKFRSLWGQELSFTICLYSDEYSEALSH